MRRSKLKILTKNLFTADNLFYKMKYHLLIRLRDHVLSWLFAKKNFISIFPDALFSTFAADVIRFIPLTDDNRLHSSVLELSSAPGVIIVSKSVPNMHLSFSFCVSVIKSKRETLNDFSCK